MNAEDIGADVHVKICSRVCDHKGIDPSASAGFRLWYTMVREGRNCTADKCHRKAMEKV